MLRSNKSFLNILSLFMLFLHPVAHAEFYGKPEESSQMQQLQTQLKEANGRITALETAKNTTDQDISAIQNNKKLEPKSEASNTDVRRSANGHGR